MRWGVLGASAAISRRVMPAIAAGGPTTLAAVAGRPQSAARTTEVAAAYGARAHHDYGALLADPAIEAVYIALPNSEHVGWTLRALDAGKHVLVEKPMALSEADAVRVQEAADAARRTVMEAFMYRFHPQQRRAADLLASGEIGDLRVVRASFAFLMGAAPGDIRLAPGLGGGATWDVGCYAVDAAMLHFGRAPRAVRAVLSRRPGADVDTSGTVLLDFGEGRSAVLDHSMDYGPRSWMELQGTHGSITIRNAWAGADEDGTLTVLGYAGTREESVPAADHYRLQVLALTDAARAGTPAPIPLSDSLRTVRVLEAVFASAADDGAAVPVAEEGTG
ncbi:Gfo/Idh/MocA family protein [Nocardiopsis sediminis]|uniref:Gfo/Idh/MocA family protein n=1 Tax=Nocardiopsis sediminis TaxID=1778267 RepID=A0ABV8FPD1_9ACTN